MQNENQDVLAQLLSLNKEREERVEEIKHLTYDNKLFRDELFKVKEDIAKYKDILDKSTKEVCTERNMHHITHHHPLLHSPHFSTLCHAPPIHTPLILLQDFTKDGPGNTINKELAEHQQMLISEVETLRMQLIQLDHSVSVERDRVEVLDLQLRKEVRGVGVGSGGGRRLITYQISIEIHTIVNTGTLARRTREEPISTR